MQFACRRGYPNLIFAYVPNRGGSRVNRNLPNEQKT